MDNPLVSIIIPAYNYGHFLPVTIESVINQTYQNWECLIIDDGSTDNTGMVVKEFLQKDHRIKYFKKQNEGRSIARNFGIEKASGDFVQLLDADDIILPQKLDKQISLIKEFTNIDIVYCDFSFFDSDSGKIIKTEHFTKEFNNPLKEILFDLGYTGFILPIHSALFKKRIFSNIHFRTNIESREDWLFWIEIASANFNFKFINEKMVLYRKHESSTVHNQRLVDYYRVKTAFIAYDLIPTHYKTVFIDYFSEKTANLLEMERTKYQKIINSKPFIIIMKVNKIIKSIFKK